MPKDQYVPALGWRWLTPVYDALVEGPMSALRMRRALLSQLGDAAGRSVLDVGCGTGSFAILLKREQPEARVAGLDGDTQILEIARAKALKHALAIEFTEGMSYTMPYPDASFDFALTSMMFHHLDRSAKERTAAEMYRVLKPGGTLLGLDFGEPRDPLGRMLKPVTRHFERVAENVDGLLPVIFEQAGFRGYVELQRFILGSIALFRGFRPQGSTGD